MRFLIAAFKRFTCMLLIAITLVGGLMPEEVAYARNNNPSRFVLNLKKKFAHDFEQNLNQRQANLIFRTLHLFPESFYGSLNKITLYFKKGHRHPRGRANDREIQLQAGKMSDTEMLAVFIHELGHVYDLGTAKGTRRGKSSNFKMKNGDVIRGDDPSLEYYRIAWKSTKRKRVGMKKHKDFVSGYGSSSPFEDFGEAFVFYVLHGDEFVKRAKNSITLRDKYHYLWGKVFEGDTFSLGSKRKYP